MTEQVRHRLAKQLMTVGLILTIVDIAIFEIESAYLILYFCASTIYTISFWINKDYLSLAANTVIWIFAFINMLKLIF